jgi:hypothetical protein
MMAGRLNPFLSSRGRGRALGALLFCSLVLGLPLHAQPGAGDAPDQTEFGRLLAAGPRREIPWETHVGAFGLTNFQRILVRVDILVPSKELVKRGGRDRLIAAVRFTDAAGRIYQDAGTMELTSGSTEGLQGNSHLAWKVFALPGEYKVGVALLDRASGQHNVALHSLRVPALKDDPLPDAWHDMPAIEFIGALEKLDSLLHPEIQGRLHLPLVTRQPVQIQLLMNLTPSEVYKGSVRVNRINLATLLPILKTFSQIAIRNGTLNVVLLDTARRRASFIQENVKADSLDWPRLKEAIAAADPAAVDVATIQHRRQNAAFFREEVAGLIGESTPGKQHPAQVFILISSPMSFDFREGLNQTEMPRECNCLFYHLRYDWSPRAQMFDDLDAVLKPLKLHTISVSSPEGLRKALASILTEVSRF